MLQITDVLALIKAGYTHDEIAALAEGKTVATSPVKPAASPKAKKAPKPDGFIAFLTTRKEAGLKSGSLVACEQPRCKGLMDARRTTTKGGKRACKRHF